MSLFVIEFLEDGKWNPSGNYRKTRAEAEDLGRRYRAWRPNQWRVTEYERKENK